MNFEYTNSNLSDILEHTVSLIGKTIVRNLIIGAIVFVIPLLLLACAASFLYSDINEIQKAVVDAKAGGNLPMLWTILQALAFFILATLIYLVAALIGQLAVSIVVKNEIEAQSISWQKALTDVFNGIWIRAFGFILMLVGLIVGAAIIAAAGFIMVKEISGVLVGFLVVLGIFVGFPLFFYCSIKWFFAFTAIAVENMGIVDAMKRSWQVVEGYWWRTFGISVLLSLLTQFAISIISLPITFASMWSVYRDFFTVIGTTAGNVDPSSLPEIQNAFSPGIAISTGVSALLSLMITPVYTVVMYMDLLGRRFPPMVQTPPEETDSTVLDLNEL